MLEHGRKIFIVSFQKTGTTSLDHALQSLGLRVAEVYTSLNKILDPTAPNAREVILNHIIERMEEVDAIQDSPLPFFYEDLDRAFPDAKFIVVHRDADSWLKSFVNFFHNKSTPLRHWMYGVEQMEGNEARIKDIYVEQNRKIRAYFADRPGKLLEMDLTRGDGWYELITFLGPDFVPPFPRKNVGKTEVKGAKQAPKPEPKPAPKAPLVQTGTPTPLFDGDGIRAHLIESGSDQLVVSFPDLVHPVGRGHAGWGHGFLSKRGLSAVYIENDSPDWYQTPDFFPAMEAIRAATSGRAKITYGSSMGGYGALLGAGAVGADRALALCPQYSIEAKVVPFERRFRPHADRLGAFRHRLDQHMSHDVDYTVVFDPFHNADHKHADLIQSVSKAHALPVYAARHHVLGWIIQNGGKEALANFIAGSATRRDFRNAIRAARQTSGTYMKRMRKRAVQHGHRRLADRVLPLALPAAPISQRHLRVILHTGLPKTGTSSIQAYLYANADAYRAAGIHYPTDQISMQDLNHTWMSQDLRAGGQTDALIHALNATPTDCNTVILSDESLFVELPGLSQAARDAARAALAPHSVDLVLFDRELDAWKLSFYIQSIQNRRNKRLLPHETALNLWQTPLIYDAFFDTDYCRTLTDFDEMEAQLATCFGAANTTRIHFDKAKDSIDTFCDAIGIPRLGGAAEVHKNPSITDCEAEILRQANALGNPHAWLIKNVIELPPHIPADKVRKNRAAKIAEAAATFPWAQLRFIENGPLRLNADDFSDTVERLRSRAMAFTARTGVAS